MSERVDTPFTAEHFVAYCLRMVSFPFLSALSWSCSLFGGAFVFPSPYIDIILQQSLESVVLFVLHRIE